ncbi:ribbon-helix-helix domain-containing protein [uncultured Jannaschia sp.]|uniref:ribbon-helix-helix domain-containing protein n=1 Tax=uncultured Jannaschia sp. TaxID=293347 RepID=UPI00260ED794|nr:ribbon-helix-helix domain-containing protein [uncultured Jannaschia sp.]
MTDLRPRKRSLTLHGHRTSVSLEDAFWCEFQNIAKSKGLSVNALAARIDRDRGVSAGLASAIRVAVLQDLRARVDRESAPQGF